MNLVTIYGLKKKRFHLYNHSVLRLERALNHVVVSTKLVANDMISTNPAFSIPFPVRIFSNPNNYDHFVFFSSTHNLQDYHSRISTEYYNKRSYLKILIISFTTYQ